VIRVLPPAGLTWAEYVDRWVDDCGGWLPLADQLIHRATGAVEIAADPQTVERGLRRLARRGHQPGGQYGRWMLRYFGFTSPVERLVRWLGTGHSRFSDLPCGLRLEHLSLWNRPPVSESPLVVWVYVGTASAHGSRLDREACAHWLGRAEPHARAAGINAELEVGLLRAQLDMELGNRAAADARHLALDATLRAADLSVVDAQCYRARLQYQRAVMCTRPADGDAPDLAQARAHYDAIPESTIPFVSFRRSVGLAYCAWKRGELDEATRLARRAVDDAGDGGLIRMRVAALNMLSRVLSPESAAVVNERARRMAAQLGDEELMQRVMHSALPPT
jgi:hypothetical protein